MGWRMVNGIRDRRTARSTASLAWWFKSGSSWGWVTENCTKWATPALRAALTTACPISASRGCIGGPTWTTDSMPSTARPTSAGSSRSPTRASVAPSSTSCSTPVAMSKARTGCPRPPRPRPTSRRARPLAASPGSPRVPPAAPFGWPSARVTVRLVQRRCGSGAGSLAGEQGAPALALAGDDRQWWIADQHVGLTAAEGEGDGLSHQLGRVGCDASGSTDQVARPEPAVELGGGHRGVDDGHRDARVGQLEPSDLGEHVERCLGGRVAAEPREDPQGGRRAHVDDGPTRPRSHHGEHRLHAHQRSDHVELEDGPEVGRVQLLEGDVQALPGVVHQCVDRAVGVDGPVDQPVDLLGDGHVGGDGERARQLGGQGLQAFRSPGGEDDPGPEPAQQAGRGGADPRGCPGDDADRLVNFHGGHSVPPGASWVHGGGERAHSVRDSPRTARPKKTREKATTTPTSTTIGSVWPKTVTPAAKRAWAAGVMSWAAKTTWRSGATA